MTTAIDLQLADSLTRAVCEMIAVPSTYPPGDTGAIMAYARDRLAASGYAVDIVSQRPGIDNLVARLGRGRPSVVFTAHADTVGPGERDLWRTDPFVGTVADGRVYGLGACNCKGPMAVQLWLADEIARRGGPKQGEVVFAFVGDEESLGPDGARYLRDAGLIWPERLVVAAPTSNQLIIEERGVLHARVIAQGRPAHAGEPQRGDNAILRMLRLVQALEHGLARQIATRVRENMAPTLSVGVIAGGTTPNVVPSRCTVELDRRLLPGETVTAALAELHAAIAAAGEPEGTWSLELMAGTNGFAARRDAPLVLAFAAAHAAVLKQAPRFVVPVGASDARYFADDGIEILITGPGDSEQGHAANEFIAIQDLVDAAHIHVAAAERLLGLG